MIEYWHWHTLHFGAETYWGGVLPHSGRPGRTYRELARLGAELRGGRRRWSPGSTRTPTSPWSTRCRASGSCRSTRRWRRRTAGRTRGVPRDLRPVLPRRLRRRPAGAHRARRAACRRRPTDAADVARRHPVLVVARPVHRRRRDARLARRLRGRRRPPRARPAHRLRRPRGPRPCRGAARAPRRGGRGLVRRVQQPQRATCRSAPPRDRRSTCRAAPRRPAGWTASGRTAPTCSPATTTRTSAAGPPSPPRRTARAGSPTSARYPTPTSPRPCSDGWSPRRPARTGGTSRPPSPPPGLPRGTGVDLRFVHNWSWDTAAFTLPVDVHDLLASSDHHAGEEVELSAWDVRVFVET